MKRPPLVDRVMTGAQPRVFGVRDIEDGSVSWIRDGQSVRTQCVTLKAGSRPARRGEHVRLPEIGISEDRRIEYSLREIRPRQAHAGECQAAEVDTAQVGQLEGRVLEQRARHAGPGQVRRAKVGVRQAGAGQLGLEEMRAREHGPGEISAAEVRLQKVCALHLRALEGHASRRTGHRVHCGIAGRGVRVPRLAAEILAGQ